AALGEALLQPVHRGPHAVVGLLEGLLRTGETAAVHAIVDLGEDALHHRLHFPAGLLRPEVRGALAMVVGPFGVEVAGDLVEIVGDDRAVTLVDHGRHGDAARVIGLALEVGVLQALDAEHRVDAALVEVEGPRPRVMHRAGHAHGNDVLQAQQAADDNRAVRPRTRLRRNQAVTVRFGRVPVLPVLGDAGGDVAHVALEVRALVHVHAGRVVRVGGGAVTLAAAGVVAG